MKVLKDLRQGYLPKFFPKLKGLTISRKKQQALVLSLEEAEYRAAVNASEEASWLRQILSKFGFEQ